MSRVYFVTLAEGHEVALRARRATRSRSSPSRPPPTRRQAGRGPTRSPRTRRSPSGPARPSRSIPTASWTASSPCPSRRPTTARSMPSATPSTTSGTRTWSAASRLMLYDLAELKEKRPGPGRRLRDLGRRQEDAGRQGRALTASSTCPRARSPSNRSSTSPGWRSTSTSGRNGTRSTRRAGGR
ncbi:MAG: hypothetical protein M0C28_42285 [Candidatus Moduliflexus flocculans]|nr:hypothetical protein [Candidatus Moduliflexus flocculans]